MKDFLVTLTSNCFSFEIGSTRHLLDTSQWHGANKSSASVAEAHSPPWNCSNFFLQLVYRST